MQPRRHGDTEARLKSVSHLRIWLRRRPEATAKAIDAEAVKNTEEVTRNALLTRIARMGTDRRPNRLSAYLVAGRFYARAGSVTMSRSTKPPPYPPPAYREREK